MLILPLAAAYALGLTAPHAGVELERFQLENGVHVIIAHVPDAPRQATFTLLPLHLGNDDAGRAQWSHLLEHHLLRSTDPDALNVEGIDINGETTHAAMRLDTIALPDHWPAAIERHARWLTARDFTAEVHAREIGVIAQEEQFTVGNSFTHKFALAAWNQAVRHGQTHAAVHRDIAESKLDEVIAYAERCLPVDDHVWIATIGPIEPAEVRRHIELHIGAVDRRERGLPARQHAEAPDRIDATWDLAARHVFIWRRLWSDDPDTLAHAQVIGFALQAQLSQDREFGRRHVAVAHAVTQTVEGRYFIINAPIPADADPQRASERIEAALDAIAGSPLTTSAAWSVRFHLTRPPDFPAMRAQTHESMRHAIEANWLLSRVNMEYSHGQSAEEIAAAIERCSADSLDDFVKRLKESPGGRVVLDAMP